MRRWLFAFALTVCTVPRVADAETLEELGTFEREAADTALARLGLTVVDAPEGKTIGKIHIVNLPVFTDRAGLLQWLNPVHVTTRDYIIRRELIVHPGDPWDDKLMREAKRQVWDTLYTGLVAMLPVKPGKDAPPNTVDLLVVTRDVWSLRLNGFYEIQGGTLTKLQIAPSENNLLGRRKTITLSFDMDQGRYSFGPRYLDKNVFGTRMNLSLGAGLLFAREDNDLEGSFANASLSLPLYQLRSEWGWATSASYSTSRVRLFLGANLRPYDNPDTEEEESIPWVYDQRSVRASTDLTRSYGYEFKNNVSVGYSFRLSRPRVVEEFPFGALENPTPERLQVLRDAFQRDALPRSERASSINLSYRFFQNEFAIYRNLGTFSLAENVKLGPDFSVSTSIALKELGTDDTFYLFGGTAGWVFDVAGDGFLSLSLQGNTRLEFGDFIDKEFGVSGFLALPHVVGLRPVLRGSLAARFDTEDNGFFTIGGDSGIRAFEIGEFDGVARFVANAELRTAPIHLWFFNAGAVLFYDVGHAADRIRDLSPHHNVGFGFRWLIPEAQPTVFRVDYAFPLNGRNSAFPGRFSAGFGQVF